MRGAGGRRFSVVVRVGVVVAAGEEADFAKDADVAFWARVGCCCHFGVAVGVFGVGLLATAAPKEEDDKGEEG